MDEIGRGTTPEDGLAVSYACLHHLHHVNRSRTLFATHFHALVDMTAGFDRLACYCTDVAENAEDGSWVYVHRLRRGVNRQSHALKVARLAGMWFAFFFFSFFFLSFGFLFFLLSLPAPRVLGRAAEATNACADGGALCRITRRSHRGGWKGPLQSEGKSADLDAPFEAGP